MFFKRKKPAVELIVNEAAPAAELQHIVMAVNNSQIRKETHAGDDYIVLPSYTLPDNVIMNGGLYKRDEVDLHINELLGTVAPIGHPKDDAGKHISINEPMAINRYNAGVWNSLVERKGSRIYIEKTIHVNTAKRHPDGVRLLEAIEKGDPIHTSVAAMAHREPVVNSEGYGWVARIQRFDHDAILLDEPGAATPEQGVGLLVNVASGVPLVTNAGALSENSYGNRQRILTKAVDALPRNPDEFRYVADFDDTHVVIGSHGEFTRRGYKILDGVATLDGETKTVERHENWLINSLLSFFGQGDKKGVGLGVDKPTQEEKPMPLEKAELDAALQANNAAVATAVADALKPLVDGFNTFTANQAKANEALLANHNADIAAKRKAVAAVHGEVVANALDGAALDEMHSRLGSPAAGASPHLSTNNQQTGAPDAAKHLGG